MATAKAATEKKVTEPAATKYIVLCLGLLIGFVVGFVMLLSNLPVNSGLADYDAYAKDKPVTEPRKFDFYGFLPNKILRPQSEPTPVEEAAKANRTIQPATRVVPANAQIVATQGQNQYREVQANFSQQQAPNQRFFLQAGNFQNHAQAQSMRAQVLLLGLEAFIVTREEADGSTAHRVRVGPYFDQNILTEAKKRLSRVGINYEIVRVTG